MGQVRGSERFREYLETFKRAMPDARAVIEHARSLVTRSRSKGDSLAHIPGRWQPTTEMSIQPAQPSTYDSLMCRVYEAGRSLPTTPTTTN